MDWGRTGDDAEQCGEEIDDTKWGRRSAERGEGRGNKEGRRGDTGGRVVVVGGTASRVAVFSVQTIVDVTYRVSPHSPRRNTAA